MRAVEGSLAFGSRGGMSPVPPPTTSNPRIRTGEDNNRLRRALYPECLLAVHERRAHRFPRDDGRPRSSRLFGLSRVLGLVRRCGSGISRRPPPGYALVAVAIQRDRKNSPLLPGSRSRENRENKYPTGRGQNGVRFGQDSPFRTSPDAVSPIPESSGSVPCPSRLRRSHRRPSPSRG